MKRIFILIGLIIPLSVYAEMVYFNKTFGGIYNDFAHSVQQTADGGYIICGQTDSYGNGSNLKPDMWIIRLDKTGKKEWDKTYGGREADVAFSVKQTADQGYIVAGFTSSFGKGYPSIWIIKLDTKGDSVWSRFYEGDIVSSANSIGLTDDGGYIVAGKGKENILKLDKNGKKEWGKRYGWVFYSVEQTNDGGYIAAGDSVFQPQEWSYIPSHYLIKLDKNGNKEWSNPLGNKFLGSAYSIQQTSDEGFILSGDSIALKSAYDHSHYALAVKLDLKGGISWKYFGREYSSAQNIRQNPDETYIAAGNTLDADHGLNFSIVLLDQKGNEKWIRTYGNDMKWEYASSILQTSDGGYIVAGQTESAGAGLYDWWILKLDGTGNTAPTGISDPVYNDQDGLFLEQNYPNPVNKSATIVFRIPESGFATLILYDIFGKVTATLFEGNLPPGEKKIEWMPSGLVNGTYFYRLQFGESAKTKSLILLR